MRFLRVLIGCLLGLAIGSAEAATVLRVDDMPKMAHWVYQRVSAATPSLSVPVSGSWSGGTQPNGVDCTALITGGGTAMAYTPVTGFTATGTTWSGTLADVPEGAYYKLTCRDHDSQPASGSQSLDWGIGIRIIFGGASNLYNEWASGTGTPNGYTVGFYPKNGCCGYGVGFAAVKGEGMNLLMNTLQASLGKAPVSGTPIPVAAVMMGMAGAPIHQFAKGAEAWTLYEPYLPDSKDAEGFILGLGQSDGDCTLNPQPAVFWPAQFASAVSAFYSATGRNSATGWVGLAVTGMGGTNDCGLTQVRAAQQRLALETEGVFLATANIDFVSNDGLHYMQPSLNHQALRIAQSIAYRLGDATQSATGPIITGCTARKGSAVITCAVRHSTSTGLALELGASAPAGFCVAANDTPCKAGSGLAIRSIAILDKAHFALTLAAVPSGPVWINLDYGNYGTGSPGNYLASLPPIANDTIGNPVLPTGSRGLPVKPLAAKN